MGEFCNFIDQRDHPYLKYDFQKYPKAARDDTYDANNNVPTPLLSQREIEYTHDSVAAAYRKEEIERILDAHDHSGLLRG